MRKLSQFCLCAAVIASAACLPIAKAHALTFIYVVTVKTNFGTTFQDCWTFADGVLTTEEGAGTLAYTAAPEAPPRFYSAVSTLSEANSLGNVYAFSGTKSGSVTNGVLNATGSDALHDSYYITGYTVSTCPSLYNSATSLYVAPPPAQ